MPIPHNGPRGSPPTERRQARPARSTAVATVAPAGTVTRDPSTVSTTASGMGVLPDEPRGQIGFDGNRRFATRQQIGQQAGGSQRSRDPQAFMPGGQEQGRIRGPGSDERELVGSRGTKPRP